MRSLLPLLALASLAGCGSAGAVARPCTTCPDVAGTYLEVVQPALASKSSCGELLSRGGTDTVVVTQLDRGSELHIQSGLGTAELVATLNEDASITAPATPAIALSGVAGSLTLSGRFQLGAEKRFEGAYAFTLTDNPCVIESKSVSQSLTVKTLWTLQP